MRFVNKRLTVVGEVSSAGLCSAHSSCPDMGTTRALGAHPYPGFCTQNRRTCGTRANLLRNWDGTPALQVDGNGGSGARPRGCAQGSREAQPEPGRAAWH